MQSEGIFYGMANNSLKHNCTIIFSSLDKIETWATYYFNERGDMLPEFL